MCKTNIHIYLTRGLKTVQQFREATKIQPLQLPQLRKIVVLGPPGSGKSTYCKILAQELDLEHISSGSIIRQAANSQTKDGLVAAKYVKEGHLVPDSLLMAILSPMLSAAIKKGGFILDGFPRTVKQAKLFHDICPVDRVVNISIQKDISTEKILGRRLCLECKQWFNVASVHKEDGAIIIPPMLPTKKECVEKKCIDCFVSRNDDTVAIVEKRLKLYDKLIQPIVSFYCKFGIVVDVAIQGGMDVMMPVFKKALSASLTKKQ